MCTRSLFNNFAEKTYKSNTTNTHNTSNLEQKQQPYALPCLLNYKNASRKKEAK